MTGAHFSDDLLLAIIHDFRSYLRPSSTGSQLISRAAGDTLPPPAREQLAMVIAANKDLEKFLGRLSDYANAPYLSNAGPVPVLAAVQTAMLRFPSAPVVLTAPSANCIPRSVAVEMVTVLTELIDNALKFSANAVVEMSIDVVADDGCSVSIRDSGVGIPRGQEDEVFHVLTRLHPRNQYPGFGLGLSIASRIAEAAGATISLTPNSPAGTVATVTF